MGTYSAELGRGEMPADPDSPTPRVGTDVWQIWATAASELAHMLRQVELKEDKDLTNGDRTRGNLARQVRHVAESYAKIFYGWTGHHVGDERKRRQTDEFEVFNTFCRTFMGLPVHQKSGFTRAETR